MDGMHFNPMDPEFVANPYPTYHRLRAEDPVHHSPLGFWVLTRYEDVVAALRDPRFAKEAIAALRGRALRQRPRPASGCRCSIAIRPTTRGYAGSSARRSRRASWRCCGRTSSRSSTACSIGVEAARARWT